MKTIFLKSILFLSMLLLTGCVSVPSFQAYDGNDYARIRTVAYKHMFIKSSPNSTKYNKSVQGSGAITKLHGFQSKGIEGTQLNIPNPNNNHVEKVTVARFKVKANHPIAFRVEYKHTGSRLTCKSFDVYFTPKRHNDYQIIAGYTDKKCFVSLINTTKGIRKFEKLNKSLN